MHYLFHRSGPARAKESRDPTNPTPSSVFMRVLAHYFSTQGSAFCSVFFGLSEEWGLDFTCPFRKASIAIGAMIGVHAGRVVGVA